MCISLSLYTYIYIYVYIYIYIYRPTGIETSPAWKRGAARGERATGHLYVT